jgi:hypothetical protein
LTWIDLQGLLGADIAEPQTLEEAQIRLLFDHFVLKCISASDTPKSFPSSAGQILVIGVLLDDAM